MVSAKLPKSSTFFSLSLIPFLWPLGKLQVASVKLRRVVSFQRLEQEQDNVKATLWCRESDSRSRERAEWSRCSRQVLPETTHAAPSLTFWGANQTRVPTSHHSRQRCEDRGSGSYVPEMSNCHSNRFGLCAALKIQGKRVSVAIFTKTELFP